MATVCFILPGISADRIGAETVQRLLCNLPILVGQGRTPVFRATELLGLFLYVLHCEDYGVTKKNPVTIADHLQ
jgi:hypothetical protein